MQISKANSVKTRKNLEVTSEKRGIFFTTKRVKGQPYAAMDDTSNAHVKFLPVSKRVFTKSSQFVYLQIDNS